MQCVSKYGITFHEPLQKWRKYFFCKTFNDLGTNRLKIRCLSQRTLHKIKLSLKDFFSQCNIARNYMLEVNNRNTRCKICSKLIIKTPEIRHWRCSGVFIVNFEPISHLILVLLLLTLSRQTPTGKQIRSFQQICSDWLKKSLMESFIFCAVGNRYFVYDFIEINPFSKSLLTRKQYEIC